jgi:diketogulonate reductase-like aldo/keto reductase
VRARPQITPPLVYGTAWKEERTGALTRLALDAGFRAIDTANQRKHYFEAAVGDAIAAAIADGVVTRAELFLQTKFTDAGGQDRRLPYDASAPYAEQVAQSFASSLEHLHTDYLDSYVLHGPTQSVGLGDDDWQIWGAMSELAREGKARVLGVSNVSLPQLTELWRASEVKPAFVQNRCYARTGWDRQVRAFCREHDIAYQGFSLLTANGRELASPSIKRIAERRGCTVAQLAFRFALDAGMVPLTGTSDPAHMRQDLAAAALPPLDADELRTLETISG